LLLRLGYIERFELLFLLFLRFSLGLSVKDQIFSVRWARSSRVIDCR
jgi:hypothetical protein